MLITFPMSTCSLKSDNLLGFYNILNFSSKSLKCNENSSKFQSTLLTVETLRFNDYNEMNLFCVDCIVISRISRTNSRMDLQYFLYGFSIEFELVDFLPSKPI